MLVGDDLEGVGPELDLPAEQEGGHGDKLVLDVCPAGPEIRLVNSKIDWIGIIVLQLGKGLKDTSTHTWREATLSGV